LTYQHRIETDDRTFGELFYACCDEVSDISFVESLYRIWSDNIQICLLNRTTY
jgi:hypothetical protein